MTQRPAREFALLISATRDFFNTFEFKPEPDGAARTFHEESSEFTRAADHLNHHNQMKGEGFTTYVQRDQLIEEMTDELMDTLVAGIGVAISVLTPEEVDKLADYFSDALSRVLSKNASKTTLTHTVYKGKITKRSKIDYARN